MNKRILLADDSLTIQKVVELTFMDESFEVEAVGSGDDAISSLEREVPSVLIADIHMPGASGYEVCRRAKELDPEIPVLLLVGTFEALDENELVACGADGNLKKPFDSQELLQIVKAMADGRSSADAAVEPAVSGFETTSYEAAAPAPAEREATGYETTAFSLDPQPGDEPEFVPSAGFDIGRFDATEETAAAEAAEDETPGATSGPDPEPMDELLGALDEVEAKPAPRADAWPGDSDAEVGAAPEPQSAAPAPPASAAAAPSDGLSEADLERVAKRVVELMSEQTVREVAWEVIPDLAEIVIKDRIRELEAEAE